MLQLNTVSSLRVVCVFFINIMSGIVTSTSFLTLFATILLSGSSARDHTKALETNEIPGYYQQTSINFIFDLFLKRYTENLAKTGRTEVQIPGFEQRYSTKVMTINIEGAVIVNDGWCKNLSTLHRTGDADMNRVHSSAILTAHLGLEELKINYKNYDVSLMEMHQRGNIHVDIGENSVWLKLSAQLKPKCEITLTDMKIEKLDGINVGISNLGIFEGMTDDITSWVANEVTRWYKDYVAQTVFPELANIVKNADLCHYLVI